MIKISIKNKYAESSEHFRGREQYNTQGMGTDLYIKKNLPGATKGRGYTVEIYENGTLVDTVNEPNKDGVIKLIKRYKEFYQTDRAFQNELQVHVTYKTKKTDNKQEKQSMDALDNVLLRQASRIQNLIQDLINPNEAKIKRSEELEQPLEHVSPSDVINNDSENPKLSVDELVKQTENKVVSYFKDNINSEIDTMYNELKSWLSEFGNIIDEYNSAFNTTVIDKLEFIEKCNEIFISGDPENYSSKITSEEAKLIQNIFSKSIGPKGYTNGEHEIPEKEASYTNIDKEIDTILGEFLREGHGAIMEEDTENKIKENSKDIVESLADKDDKSEDEVKLYNIAKYEEEKSAEFWKYIKQSHLTGSIEDLYYKWAVHNCASLSEIENVWYNISSDIDDMFGTRKAVRFADRLMVIRVKNLKTGTYVFEGEITWDNPQLKDSASGSFEMDVNSAVESGVSNIFSGYISTIGTATTEDDMKALMNNLVYNYSTLKIANNIPYAVTTYEDTVLLIIFTIYYLNPPVVSDVGITRPGQTQDVNYYYFKAKKGEFKQITPEEANKFLST